jgi:hypothetical protein
MKNMKKIVGIASTPDRVEGLKDALADLSPQVNHIYVWLNGYKEIPEVGEENVTFHLSEENIGAVGKLKVRDIIPKNEKFYFFTCDDDILYPTNYIEHNITNYTEGSFQSSHTGLYKSYPISNYYKETERNNNIPTFFTRGCAQKFAVHIGGTGVMMCSSDILWEIPVDDFLDYPNMLDPWIGVYAHMNDIPIYTLIREDFWLKENPKINQSNSIFYSDAGRGEIQTQIINHYFCSKLNKHQPVPIN